MPKLQRKLHDYYKKVHKPVLCPQNSELKASPETKLEKSSRKRCRSISTQEEDEVNRTPARKDDLNQDNGSCEDKSKLQHQEDDLKTETKAKSGEPDVKWVKMSPGDDVQSVEMNSIKGIHKEIPSVKTEELVHSSDEISKMSVSWDFLETLSLPDVIKDKGLTPPDDDPGISWDAIPVDSVSWNSIPCESSAASNLSFARLVSEPSRTNSPLPQHQHVNSNMTQPSYGHSTAHNFIPREPAVHSQPHFSAHTRPNSCSSAHNWPNKNSNPTNPTHLYTNTHYVGPQLERFCTNSENIAWNGPINNEAKTHSTYSPMINYGAYNSGQINTVYSKRTSMQQSVPCNNTANNPDGMFTLNNNSHFKALRDAVGFGPQCGPGSLPWNDGPSYRGPSMSPPVHTETKTHMASRRVTDTQEPIRKPSSLPFPRSKILAIYVGRALNQFPGRCLTLDGIVQLIQVIYPRTKQVPPQQFRQAIWHTLNNSQWFVHHTGQGQAEKYWTIHQSWIGDFKKDASRNTRQ